LINGGLVVSYVFKALALVVQLMQHLSSKHIARLQAARGNGRQQLAMVVFGLIGMGDRLL